MRERLFFSAFREHYEPLLQKVGCVGVHLFSGTAPSEVCQRMLVRVILPLIDLTGGNAVAEHLLNVTDRHPDGIVGLGNGVDVGPILIMVAVATLVVHPRRTVAENLALALVRTPRSLIVARARQKLGGRIFGKVVKQPLKTDPRAEAMQDHAVTVLCDGVKMAERM